MRPRSIYCRTIGRTSGCQFDPGSPSPKPKHRQFSPTKFRNTSDTDGCRRRTAQNAFTDERLLAFAQSLAVSLSDEAPGADLIGRLNVFPRCCRCRTHHRSTGQR